MAENPSFRPDCPACVEKRRHSPEERAQFHPLSGHGFKGQGQGWSNQEAQEAHERENRKDTDT